MRGKVEDNRYVSVLASSFILDSPYTLSVLKCKKNISLFTCRTASKSVWVPFTLSKVYYNEFSGFVNKYHKNNNKISNYEYFLFQKIA